jgi:hypothetical protein
LTFTLMALLLFLGVIGVIMPLAQSIRIRFSPKFMSLTRRTRYTLSVLVICSLLYELSFLFVYLTNHLYKFPRPWGDIYWVSTGLSGIIFGMLGVNCPPRLIWMFSILQFIIGLGLLGLLVLAIGITSM